MDVLMTGLSVSSIIARNDNLITNPILVSKLNVLLRNTHHKTIRIRLNVHIHISIPILPTLSSPQSFNSLLHHIRDESP